MFEIEELGIDIGGFNYRKKKWKVLRELFVLDLCDVSGEDKKNYLSNSYFLGPKDFLCDFRNKSLPRFYNN